MYQILAISAYIKLILQFCNWNDMSIVWPDSFYLVFTIVFTDLSNYHWHMHHQLLLLTHCLHSTGNANLVYTIIRKRNIFHQLANLPIDHTSIAKALTRRSKQLSTQEEVKDTQHMDGSRPATDAQPGTLKASLAAVPGRWRSY